jgi:hypothetical protein
MRGLTYGVLALIGLGLSGCKPALVGAGGTRLRLV